MQLTLTQPVSPIPAVEAALSQFQEGTLEHSALSNLKTLYLQVEQTIQSGEKVFGKGVFKMFDFIKDCLPE
jgi:hypothetical protein